MDNAQNGYSSADNTGKIKKTNMGDIMLEIIDQNFKKGMDFSINSD